MESVYEQFHYMKYYGGWSFLEAYNLPIGLRSWFFNRLRKQLESEVESMEKAKRKGGR
jgi:hypothetical protein